MARRLSYFKVFATGSSFVVVLAALFLLLNYTAIAVQAFVGPLPPAPSSEKATMRMASTTERITETSSSSRRSVLEQTAAVVVSLGTVLQAAAPAAHAVGPVKVTLKPTGYFAVPCPPDKPIPGEKAMNGMKGLCVTVTADLLESPPKELEKVGVYGFVTDGISGDSVLANNPDLSTDAGQFAMIEAVKTTDKTVTFEFIAAVPRDLDTRPFSNGIGPLNFASLRIISFPGGQQFGAISPCEMNEFSDECETWEAENGPFLRGEYMIKSNVRTKGR